MSDKSVLYKLANIIKKQNEIVSKLAQQIVDTSQPITDPLGKVVRDATIAWVTKSGMSAKSSFTAKTNGKYYDIDVVLNITDPKKPSGVNASSVKEIYRKSFLEVLQYEFDKASKDITSPLNSTNATFNVNVVG